MTEKNKTIETTAETKAKALLVGLVTPDISEGECELSLDELERLAETAEISSMGRLCQNRAAPDPASYIGKGKLEEAKAIMESNEINVAIIDGELSPSQIKNIGDFLGGIEVIDRTMLILEIFEKHAHTSEGKLQVEIAKLRYTLPRLVGKGKDMSRIGGGGGGTAGARRGSGETKLEVERRNAKARISALEQEIEKLGTSRNLTRSRRQKAGIPNIAIAGYTNSGKSTLLNYLTDAGVLAENKLFATLDPTTRKLRLPNGSEVLLTDTVGLIRKLPHHLVQAFKSTLDEINYADIILLVSDISDPEHQSQLEVAAELLSEMGITQKPIVTIYNKIDMRESPPAPDGVRFPEAYISAKTGEGIEDLLAQIQQTLETLRKSVVFAFPADGSQQGHINYLYRNAAVSEVEYGPDFATVRASADEKTRNMYAKYLAVGD
ncbi:MAG: GTPase HflX [Oscillospiraceae bacterium]|nr:GTPase HflX [Oscillospiraceae bacterium]